MRPGSIISDSLLRLTIGLGKLFARLPYPLLFKLGRGLGWLLYWSTPKRRHIARVNLELCFPERTPAQIDQLLKAHYISLGQGFTEAIWGWWGRHEKRPQYQIDGLEHLEKARSEGRGVLLYTGHFTCMELGTYFLTLHQDLGIVYRPNRHPLINQAIDGGRKRHAAALFPKDQTLRMVRWLKKGSVLWIAPDQSYSRSQSAMLPFFGISCATNIAVPTLAKMGNAVIIPFFVHRDNNTFYLKLHPPVKGIPSENEASDTLKLVHYLEEHIRNHPADYLWGHRRFKKLADGRPSPY